MSEIVNLNKARKQRLKQAAVKTAGQNRAKFGLTKQARDLARRERELQARKVDGAQLRTDPERDN